MTEEWSSYVALHWSLVIIGLEVATKQYMAPWMFEVTHSFLRFIFIC